jgi:hypothetical protein
MSDDLQHSTEFRLVATEYNYCQTGTRSRLVADELRRTTKHTFAASLLDPQRHFHLLGRSSRNEMWRVNCGEGLPVRTWDGF